MNRYYYHHVFETHFDTHKREEEIELANDEVHGNSFEYAMLFLLGIYEATIPSLNVDRGSIPFAIVSVADIGDCVIIEPLIDDAMLPPSLGRDEIVVD